MGQAERARSVRNLRRGCVPAFALLLWTLPVGGSALASGQASTASASSLRVTQVEYRLELSSGSIKAGPVNLEAVDRGLDPHDLRLQAEGSHSELAVPQLTPGKRWSGVVRLAPGVYRLWCSLPEHARLGMHATLRVVR